jgi:hypothetical protein
MRLCSVLQRVFGDDEGSWCCRRRRRIKALGAVVKARRGGDEAIVCSQCRRRINALVAVDAVGGSMRLLQSSRLAEEETKQLFAVVKALGGGDVAVLRLRRWQDLGRLSAVALAFDGSEEASKQLVAVDAVGGSILVVGGCRRLRGGCRWLHDDG